MPSCRLCILAGEREVRYLQFRRGDGRHLQSGVAFRPGQAQLHAGARPSEYGRLGTTMALSALGAHDKRRAVAAAVRTRRSARAGAAVSIHV